MNSNAYNIPGCIGTKRGFVFGCKYYIKSKQNQSQPQFGRVITEFDELLQRASKGPFKDVNNFPERFKVPVFTEPGNSSHITKKFERREQNRFNSKIVIEKEENLRTQMQRQLDKDKADGNFLLRQINYSSVEEAAPKYTMKRRYEHDGIFNIKSNVGNINSLNSNRKANAK